MDYNYIITSPKAPLLLHPEKTSELADEALYGMLLNVLQTDGIWSQVTMEYGYTGWILNEHINVDENESWDRNRNALIQSPFADVMPNNTYRGYPIINLPKGSHLVCLSDSPDKEGWLKVELHDKTCGYCRQEWVRRFSDFPESHDEEAIRTAVVRDALSYIGTSYKWGGKSPAGIDCSGLTFMSYWMNGIHIYRDARIEDGYLVSEINHTQHKAGDLLYFPGHIAMVIKDGTYVHSTGSQGGVVINSLDPNHEKYHTKLAHMHSQTGSIFKLKR